MLERLESRQRDSEWLKRQVKEEILVLLEKEIARHLRCGWERNGNLDRVVRQVMSGERDPYSFVREIIEQFAQSCPEIRT
jgi:LAO/AO transport system kinase